jgi:stage IV sporulation protein A
MLITTDGTIADIPRESYVNAEERVARELKESGKPFAIVLNSACPECDSAHALAVALEEKYGVPVALVNCMELNADDVSGILSLVVGEFPVRELTFTLPDWTAALPEDHRINREMLEEIKSFSDGVTKLSDISAMQKKHDCVKGVAVDAGCGMGTFEIPLSNEEYYSALSEFSGMPLSSAKDLFAAVVEMASVKREYDRISEALKDVREKGYGIVMPTAEELSVSEPTLVKQGAGYGIKVSAEAESIHMIKAAIKTDVCPALGSEEQSEEVIKTMSAECGDDPKRMLESKLFGRTLYDMVNDGMNAKLLHLPDDSRERIGQTLEKIINEGASGLICILL